MAMISKISLILILLLPMEVFGQLRVHPTGQYLYEKQTGLPVFINGESIWCLFTAATYLQVDTLFQNCQQYGINLLECIVPEDGMTANAPANTNGDNPFSGAFFSTTPNEDYFTHVDSIVALAKTYGIYLHIYITYLGSSSAEGVQTEVSAASTTNMEDWGTFMGTRYRDSTNVLWGISGDIDPTPWQTKLDAMAAALLVVDTNHLITPRDELNTRTQTHWSGRNWLKLEYIYPYWGPQEFLPTRIISFANTIYGEGRTGWLEEAWYENEKYSADYPTAIQIRQQMYYAVLAGAKAGHVFGNGPMWGLGEVTRSWFGPGDFRTFFDSQGHISTGVCGSFFRSRDWYNLIPDPSNTLLTAGQGSGESTALAARAQDSTCIIAYMPSNRTITLNTNYMRARDLDSVHASWINPANGDSTYIGTYARSSSQQFTPSGSQDWILVLDTDLNEPPPQKFFLRR